MQKRDEGSGIELTPKIVSFTELGFGLLVALMGTYGMLPIFEIWLAVVILMLIFIPLLLYFSVAMIVGPVMTFDYNSKPLYIIGSIIVVSIMFAYPFLGDLGIAIVAILSGVLIIFLSIWHYRTLH